MKQKILPPSKLLPLADLQSRLSLWRLKSDRIVFTNGCFDLFHAGHVKVLQEAAAFGDRLIVGLNADASVARLKGPKRPVIAENFRADVLSALHCIDAIVLFEEDTPANLIESIVPDFLVKGGDYEIDQIVGADFVVSNGGQVETIPLLEGFSSTDLMKRFSNS